MNPPITGFSEKVTTPNLEKAVALLLFIPPVKVTYFGVGEESLNPHQPKNLLLATR
jgi:hypothetical protein